MPVVRLPYHLDRQISDKRETPRLLRTAEAAERLSLSAAQLRKKANLGQVPAIRLGPKGSSLRFDADELERWIHDPEPQEAA